MLLQYLWLVLPFWQAIESVTKQADQLSLFIWSNAVKKEAKDRTEDRTEARDRMEDRTEEGDELGDLNYKAIH